MRLLDDIGVEDVDAIQRKLSAVSDDYTPQQLERAASLESLLHKQKRKNQAN